MDSRINKLLSSLACLFLALSLSAQIYSRGDDPGKLKWNSFRTDEFKLIYPSGLDSLARVYAVALESHRRAVGRSIGVEPNQMYRKPIPVILHSHLAAANGMVTWAPHRMELDTGPDALRPDPLNWVTTLSIHESRHVAQMQLGRDRFEYKAIKWLTGDALPGIMSGIYPGPYLLEGDAVAAETALTTMGRGRSADFLEYYMASFAEGEMRDWYRWRYGSLKYFTPDHYKIGYLTVAGTRYLYDTPDFTARYFSNISSGFLPFPFFVMNKTLKQTSGMKLRKTWEAIAAVQNDIWQADIAARGPFKEAEKLTPTPKRFTQYSGSTMLEGGLYTISNGIATGSRLVHLDKDGGIGFRRPFSRAAGSLMASEATGRIYWSEIVPDMRWTLKETSRIRYMEPGHLRFKTLTRKGRLFNPAPSPDGNTIAVTEYPTAGGSAVEVLDAASGQVLSRHPAPDTLQVVESAWVGGRILASAIGPSGFGIYDVSGGYATLLEPQPVKISQLRTGADGLLFVSDRLGVNELYCLKEDGKVSRLSNNKIGASDFVVTGDSLWFSALTSAERAIYREKMTPVGEVDFSSRYHHPVADKLSEQEAELAEADGLPGDESGLSAAGAVPDGVMRNGEDKEIYASEPRRYRKLPHLFRFHTWVPLYVDSDAIADFSLDRVMSDASPGIMAMFQNHLGTASGSIGYSHSLQKRTLPTREPSGFHARLTYTGLYPVFEFKLDVTDEAVYRYGLSSLRVSPTRNSISMTGKYTGQRPSVSGSVKVYIPLNFSSGGWNRGLVPQATLAYSNDYINLSVIKKNYVSAVSMDGLGLTFFDGAVAGPTRSFTRLTASIRGYTMTATPPACTYPRWGVGAEAGVSLRPGFSDILSTNVYGYVYGYVPGLLPGHGIRLTALAQRQRESLFTEMYTTVLPRGFEARAEINRYVQARYPAAARFGVEYAMPLLNLDWSGLGPLAYVKNIDIRPHFEYSVFSGSEQFADGGLFSAGSELCLNLGNLAMIPYSTRIGVSYSRNGGKSWEAMQKNAVTLSRDYFGFVLSVSM